ncbi:NAD-binding protein [Schizopora paradoxa]|uniref:NAD-binding protein n=1 Tax=Schizopora paradoxa TaxID=27342 RepID=A0A0H2RB09_9AGAM|nr:NAD-binding protein [Schizopora paradoxa]
MFWKIGQLWKQSFFIPKPKFTADDVPDLSGKVVIVTGGNTGIGKETVKALLRKNATVYMAARSKSKADAAIADLESQLGKKAHFIELDLADLASVRKAAQTFKSQENSLNILFNNGGVMFTDIKDVTKQGYDLQFGVNVLGHFYFTKLLLPTMQETAKTAPPGSVRVVTTSSSAAFLYQNKDIDYTTLKEGETRTKLGSHNLYAQSKLASSLVSTELARRYAAEGIVSISVNPGNISSDLQRNITSFAFRTLNKIMLHPTPFGAITQLYAGTSPEAGELNGKFLIPWARLGQHSKDCNNPESAQRVWEYLESQVNAFEEGNPESA